jgi:hypothetical protein
VEKDAPAMLHCNVEMVVRVTLMWRVLGLMRGSVVGSVIVVYRPLPEPVATGLPR